MTVRCPTCNREHPLPAAAGARGHMVRCRRCGTHWLARPYEGLLPLAEDRIAVSDAIVVDDSTNARVRPPPPPKATRLPPRWRQGPVDRRLKALGIVCGVIAALVILQAPLVAALPEAKRAPIHAGSLEFQKVRSETVTMRGVSTLFVEGEIVNRAPGHVELPAIEITLKSSDGAPVTSWLVEPVVDSLASGRSIGFRSALVSPPPNAAQVTLNLAERQGLVELR